MAIISKTLLGPYLLFALPVVMSRHRRCGTKISPKAACSPRGLFLSVWHVLQSVQGEGWDTMFPPGTFKNCILQDPSSICILVGCRLHFIPCQAPCGASSAGLEPGKLQLFHHLPHRSRHFLPLNPTPNTPNLHIGPRGGEGISLVFWVAESRGSGRSGCLLRAAWPAGWQSGHSVLTACALGWGPHLRVWKSVDWAAALSSGCCCAPRRRSDTVAGWAARGLGALAGGPGLPRGLRHMGCPDQWAALLPPMPTPFLQ